MDLHDLLSCILYDGYVLGMLVADTFERRACEGSLVIIKSDLNVECLLFKDLLSISGSLIASGRPIGVPSISYLNVENTCLGMP